jgi:hypothetical protein
LNSSGSFGSVFNFLLVDEFFDTMDDFLLLFFDNYPDFSVTFGFSAVLDFISDWDKEAFCFIGLLLSLRLKVSS